jgi:uncharacterized protein YdcH (DUF465 family)
MSDIIIAFFKQANPAQLIALGAMGWFFYNRLKQEQFRLKQELSVQIDKTNERIDKTNERIDKLCEKVEDIDRRLCRIEGSLTIHGHCLFKHGEDKKAL